MAATATAPLDSAHAVGAANLRLFRLATPVNEVTGLNRWLFSDDPNHGWIRHTWTHQEIDPRLPLTGPRTTEQASTR